MKKDVKLSPPWITYVNMITVLFEGDKDIKIEYDNDNYTLNLYVNGESGKKAEAIEKLLPSTIPMGNITFTINVIPADKKIELEDYSTLVATAFSGNPHFDGIKAVSYGMMGTFTYGLFKKEIVQFYNDDLTQFSGMESVILADIAKELLNPPTGFYFSTNTDK